MFEDDSGKALSFVALEDGESEEERKEADDGNNGKNDGTEVFAALDFAMDAKDVGFVLVAGRDTVNTGGEGDDNENADDDKNGFHGLIIA